MFASLRKAAKVVFDPAFSRRGDQSPAAEPYSVRNAVRGGLVRREPSAGARAPWINDLLAMLATILMVVLPFFLGAPVAAFFGSFFLDEIAAEIEARYYPADPRASGGGAALHPGIGWHCSSSVSILCCYPQTWPYRGWARSQPLSSMAGSWPGIFRAGRVAPPFAQRGDGLRRRHRGGIFAAGLIISLATLVPIVNLLAPLFGAAFMVHIFKLYVHEDRAV